MFKFRSIGVILLSASIGCAAKTATPNNNDTSAGDTVDASMSSNMSDATVPSGNNGDSNPVVDSGNGSNMAVDSGSPSIVDSGPSITNQAQCIALCETTYPKAADLNHQLDGTCILAGACESVCNDLGTPGVNFPPTPDPDASAPNPCPIGEGVDPISTPSAACSSCLANTPACCMLWVEIFGSMEGRSLSSCAVACVNQFKN